MEFHDEFQKIEGCVINDPLALALTFMPELCTYQELPVEVDHLRWNLHGQNHRRFL